MTEPARVRGHIPWPPVEARLLATRSVILCTTRSDGRPHALPVWFCWQGRSLYFITARGTTKARNLRGQRWAVAHAGDGDDVLYVEGPVRQVADADEKDRVDSCYRAKYVDPESGARASIYDNPLDDLYRMDVRRVVTWMYGAVAGWTEWRHE